MQLDVNKDPKEESRLYRAYLDDELQLEVLAANEEEGWVEILDKDFPNWKLQKPLPRKRIHGKVELRKRTD